MQLGAPWAAAGRGARGPSGRFDPGGEAGLGGEAGAADGETEREEGKAALGAASEQGPAGGEGLPQGRRGPGSLLGCLIEFHLMFKCSVVYEQICAKSFLIGMNQ